MGKNEKQQIFIWGDRHSITLPSEDPPSAGGFEWHVIKKPGDIFTETPGYSVVAIIVDGDKAHADPEGIRSAFLQKGQPAPLIILISAFRLTAMALALQAGFDEFLAKPVGTTQIMALIKKHKQKDTKQ